MIYLLKQKKVLSFAYIYDRYKQNKTFEKK